MLHDAIQLAMGWSDTHLNRFIIHGTSYGVAHCGGIDFSHRAEDVRLCDFGFRLRERFLYEYDFTDGWQLDVRLERRLRFDTTSHYPRCIGGGRACPPEDCGGAWAFMELEDDYSLGAILCRLEEFVEGDEDVADLREELDVMLRWLSKDQFDVGAVNERLDRYQAGDNPLESRVM